MRFSPKTDKELAESNLLPKGEYDYEVIGAEDTTSQSSGAEMIKLKLRIYHGEAERTLFDYLMEAMAGKLKHFCDQNGLQQAYQDGTLSAADCVGKCGKADIGIEKDKTGKYPDKNNVRDYPIAKTARAASGAGFVAELTDDDVPAWAR